ncbi:monooxygenase [Paractinoplanes abujensis]|uniref:2-polyprenyl-6-methoxyphenol hydroxylase-like FAD-dependent oxidoreductase n=1 Tax=Paractinoplanes abujensis TaxID=882441 RepID=A0A7W7CLB3_9ACTN|nr:FAD-dependent monooxygenase [Actinoplanes abujensis]MBB4690646.1 2-polyprenyl-6-methoxyphenol hydroxylase-like FAD-dependent oxidoreductase [Actinoplanes abujensis]GID17941.1 monooxygenase [Actinoplanes abujensis]
MVTPRIAIAGAGIGGLTLAHALRRRGFDCVLFERDRHAQDTDGYRLHLTEEAFTALAEVLPESSLRALRECGSGNDAFRQFAVLDHRGHTRLRLPVRHSGDILMIGRRPLRTVLARGLEHTVRWGTPVTGFTSSPTGVRLDDGTEADLLVAADGTHSRTARHLLGRPAARPAGVAAIAGRSPLPQRIPADLRHGLAFMIGPYGVGAFLSLHDRSGDDRGRPHEDHARRVDDAAAEAPYVVWSLAAAEAGGTDLIASAHRLAAGWTADFHTLIDNAEPGSVAAFPFHFPAALEPWPPGRVTLLGDAVHPMPPTAGAGASTAILDAVHLADDLATHPIDRALMIYQARLLSYAPRAVNEARPPLRWQRRLANPFPYAVATQVLLPSANAVLGLGRRLRTRTGSTRGSS